MSTHKKKNDQIVSQLVILPSLPPLNLPLVIPSVSLRSGAGYGLQLDGSYHVPLGVNG